MRTPNVTQDYNEMMRIKARMDAYERTHMGSPSMALQEELNQLLQPYADRHKAERNPSDTTHLFKTA